MLDRIMKHVRIEPATGCWMWTGHTSNGYGKMTARVDGRPRCLRVHRVAYELVIGPIPKGLDLDHLCRNRACVNPAHLEPVTRRENLWRGVNPSSNGSRDHLCKRGHFRTPENTYIDHKGWKRCLVCAKMVRRLYYLAHGR